MCVCIYVSREPRYLYFFHHCQSSSKVKAYRAIADAFWLSGKVCNNGEHDSDESLTWVRDLTRVRNSLGETVPSPSVSVSLNTDVTCMECREGEQGFNGADYWEPYSSYSVVQIRWKYAMVSTGHNHKEKSKTNQLYRKWYIYLTCRAWNHWSQL